MCGGQAIRGMSDTNYREEYDGLEFNGGFHRDLQLQHALPVLVWREGADDNGSGVLRRRAVVSSEPRQRRRRGPERASRCTRSGLAGPTLLDGNGTGRLYIDDG